MESQNSGVAAERSSEATPQNIESTESPKPGTGREDSEGEDNDQHYHVLPHSLSEWLHFPEGVNIFDPRFRRYSHIFSLNRVYEI